MNFEEILIHLPKPYYSDDAVAIIHADCRDILLSIRGVSAVITDPPYELGFMGKAWDRGSVSFQIETWQLIRESCLLGAMLLSFGGTRTSHRIACAIEDAGWQIRDTIMWVYGSGFPKSHNLSGAIDKKLGYGDRGHRIAVASRHHPDGTLEPNGELLPPYEAKSPEAKLWEGYGTALKPAYEPIIVAMNPLDGTFANNALKHKIAGLNIDECRVGVEKHSVHGKEAGKFQPTGGQTIKDYHEVQGRFPANFIHDGSQEVMELFPNTGGGHWSYKQAKGGGLLKLGLRDLEDKGTDKDISSAVRFFKTCEQDTCNLFSLLLLLKHGIMNIGGISCKTQQKLNTLARTVEGYFGSILATIENTAPENVGGKPTEQSALNVKSVENQCDICGTYIALVLAEIKTLDFSHEELQAIQAYTGSSNIFTLIQNLVSYAGKLENTDTILIITDLLTSFGCVNPAIINSTLEIEKLGLKRFLYTAKASRRERDAGLEDMGNQEHPFGERLLAQCKVCGNKGLKQGAGKQLTCGHTEVEYVKVGYKQSRNNHPTVKPLSLMTYLCSLVKMPEYNLILDPFCGSGSTLLACKKLGIPCIGIESSEEYCEIAAKRCSQSVMKFGE